jgi:FeS assembly protein IscX
MTDRPGEEKNMSKLKWADADEIGFQLHQKFPAIDPLQVRFTELQQRVMELEEFSGTPEASNEKTLEAIQMAWLEYYRGE